MATAYLSIGSNMGQRHRLIEEAIALLSQIVGKIVKQSSVIETEPWGFNSDNSFLNAAVCIETLLTPQQLLHETQHIEHLLGRTHKTVKALDGLPTEGNSYADRTIDIDILLYDDLEINNPDLQIPHPLMYQREFVMRPLTEILPNIKTSDAGRRIEKSFKKALTQYNLIEDGDNILIGLSGGKDSLLLTELLALRSRIYSPRFAVTALHVRMSNIEYSSDTKYLEIFCRLLGINLKVVTTSFTEDETNKKPPCFLCSWYRRKEMFRVAQQLGCNKIALGHHQDDILHTALMNIVFEGRFSSMPAMLKMDKMPLTIIRPLAYVREKDIATYAVQRHYAKQLTLCPHEHDTRRQTIRQLFQHIETLNPEARYSIWHALHRER